MVFLSLDLEEDQMVKYLQEPKLKCPAIKFDALADIKKALQPIYDAENEGVPAYILVDNRGKILAKDSKEPKEKIAELIKTGAAE